MYTFKMGVSTPLRINFVSVLKKNRRQLCSRYPGLKKCQYAHGNVLEGHKTEKGLPHEVGEGREVMNVLVQFEFLT